MLFSLEIYCKFEFTNVNCTSNQKEIAEFEYCHLKSINRSYKYISGKIKLYEIPLSRITVNLIMWKRFNGYKPFLYNITVDFCKFLDKPKSSPVGKFIYDSYMNYSNVNHPCPFTHDMILEKLPISIMNYRMTKILPFPEGDYLFEFRWLRARSVVVWVKVFFTIS
ncbi:uncharacterized protein LOC128251899 [Drosophila gunungcola]|nr:uncharacterized protein LOC128251899 [Drosophila gunungcola]